MIKKGTPINVKVGITGLKNPIGDPCIPERTIKSGDWLADTFSNSCLTGSLSFLLLTWMGRRKQMTFRDATTGFILRWNQWMFSQADDFPTTKISWMHRWYSAARARAPLWCPMGQNLEAIGSNAIFLVFFPHEEYRKGLMKMNQALKRTYPNYYHDCVVSWRD